MTSDPGGEASAAAGAQPGGRRHAGRQGRPPAPRTLLVTGMSGAGRSTTLKSLEDLGYEAVDNLPLSLLEGVLRGEAPADRPVAIGIDVRTRGFAVQDLLQRLDRAASGGAEPPLLFLDCDDEVLRRRFTETRRRHPLAEGRPLADGIAFERRLLTPLRERATLVLDTSSLAPAELKRILAGHFGSETGPMSVFVLSFSYRGGLPREADLVFDVRFLRNPHYDPDLRPLTGLDPAIGAFVADDPAFAGFRDSLAGLFAALLPRYEQEGKSYLTIAFGCTGGRHRSVYVAEVIGEWLKKQGWRVDVTHRELARDGVAEGKVSPAAAERMA